MLAQRNRVERIERDRVRLRFARIAGVGRYWAERTIVRVREEKVRQLRLIRRLRAVAIRRLFARELEAAHERVADRAGRERKRDVREIRDVFSRHRTAMKLAIRRTRRSDAGVAIGVEITRQIANAQRFAEGV